MHWRGSIPGKIIIIIMHSTVAVTHTSSKCAEVRIEELEGAEHREILSNRSFFKLLIEYVSERKTGLGASEKEGGKGAHKTYLVDIDDAVLPNS